MRGGQRHRILALYPCARGVGFALLDRERRLVDWGMKGVRGNRKNQKAMHAIVGLIEHHHPSRIVVERTDAKGSRRHARIRALHERLDAYARNHNVHVRAYTRPDINGYFGVRTKHELAVVVARALPALAIRVPPRRKAWMSEDARQSLFDAAALALRCLGTIEGTPQSHRANAR